MTTDLTTIERDILAINDEADAQHIARTIQRVEWLTGRARELDKLLKQALIEYLDQPGGPQEINIGDVRYYVGNKKTIKCRDNRRTVEALLNATGGDFEKFVECLSSNALKHGACRTVLGDEFDSHFEEKVDTDLKTGAPTREVKRIDARFMPKRKEATHGN